MDEIEKEQEWKALARIARSPEGRKLLDWLRREREEHRNQLERAPEHAQLLRLQGEARFASKVLDKLDQAEDVVRNRYDD